MNARNYKLAMLLCISTTVLSLMGEHGLENWRWYLMSDVNVAIFLFIAWLFDNQKRERVYIIKDRTEDAK